MGSGTSFENRAFWCMAVLLTAALGVLAMYRYDADALWRFVQQECEPAGVREKDRLLCRTMSRLQRHALLWDRARGLHDLLVPTDQVRASDVRKLQLVEMPNYFWMAWQARGDLSVLAGRSIPDTAISVAMNSQYARSQNQLHLHIACLRADVRRQLAIIGPRWSDRWGRYWLHGHAYSMRALSEAELRAESIFARIGEELEGIGTERLGYGVMLTQLQDGRFLLMVLPVKLFGHGATLGRATELQDDGCATAETEHFPSAWYSRVLRPGVRALSGDDG